MEINTLMHTVVIKNTVVSLENARSQEEVEIDHEVGCCMGIGGWWGVCANILTTFAC